MAADAEQVADFARAHSRQLQRAAWLLTGDWATAEDLVQAVLVKMWQRWPTIENPDARMAYARRALMTTFLGWRRRRWLGEVCLGWIPDTASADVHAEDTAALFASLRRLPPHQRAVIVLCYFDDLTEAAAAEVLGCSVGTVKSQKSRALRTLRADAELRDLFAAGSR